MNDTRLIARRASPAVALLAAAVALSGCMGPTYGTGTPSGQQTLEDVTGILSIGGRDRQEPIAYQPRGELVRPGSTEVLPQPQQSATGGEAWPESPEQRLARVRADATANQDVNFAPEVRSGSRGQVTEMRPLPRDSEIETTLDGRVNTSGTRQREEFNRRLAASQQGSATERRFLSEPPTSYRQPAATAAVGDVGEDEWRKQRAAAQAQGRATWRDWIPGL